MKIYTKNGDQGETSLIGGRRVAKNNAKIDACGTADELNAWVGLIADGMQVQEHQDLLREIQRVLFVIGSQLASDPGHEVRSLPEVHHSDIEKLEQSIDQMTEGLAPLKHFILPGGHERVSQCHIARAVCRRFERSVVKLTHRQDVNEIILQYVNRLSDYLFTLARFIANELGVEEVLWEGK